ncbi:hypothetical protein G9A89_019619 [Geosiphon pyriformis]|nr:hypothetical protein G9A89_019619 [Geosiphon pyriformis]
MDKTTIESLTDNTKPKVAESENIGANHLGFAKSLFQHYCQHLRLNHNHISAKLAFNFYVNKKIFSLLGTPVNTESAKKTFYRELIQNTNLRTNHNFAFIITEINKEIKHHTQQRYLITYASKGKEKLQTPAKKTRVELPTAPSYHYTLGKEEEEELEDQEFTYQNPITKNLEIETPNFQAQQNLNLENSEIETPNHQRQNNPNPKLINQQNLPLVIVIDQLPINPVAEPIQQLFQLPPQQPVQQQLLQQPPQQPNLDSMAYTPIAKLDNFTGKKNNTQTEFVRYFSNNNSINKLVNLFTTIKQGDTEAVTTYFHKNLRQIQAIQADYFTAPQILNQFIRGLRSNLLQQVHPMHPVDLPTAVTHARDFEAAELKANHAQAVNLVMNRSSKLDSKLKQFICYGSQKHVSVTTVVNKAIFKLIAILIATNNQKINTEIPIATTNLSTASILTSSLSITATSNLSTAVSSNLSAAAPNNLSVSTINPNTTPKLSYDDIRKPKIQNCSKLEISDSCLSTNPQLLSQLEISDSCLSTNPQLLSPKLRTPFSKFRYSLLVTPENATPNNQELKQTPTSNIPPATITEDKSLDAIFPFKLEELSTMPLFSRATLKEKPITTMYTDVKINGHLIKLILDNGCRVNQAASTRIITTDGTTKTPISEIDDFSFKVNSIVTLIKVLVIEATQY